MTIFDYLLGFGALALMLWNMRRKELTDRRLMRPLIIAATICVAFLHGVPATGADGALVGAGVLLGIGFGAVGALATRVERDGAGRVMAAASPLAIGVTAAAFGGRMAFAVAATNGLGPAIGRFSASIGVHSAQAWVAALVLMASADLVTRAAILWQRRAAVARPSAAGIAARPRPRRPSGGEGAPARGDAQGHGRRAVRWPGSGAGCPR